MPPGYVRLRLVDATAQVAASVLPLLVAWWLFVLDADDREGYLSSLEEALGSVAERFQRARELVPAGFVDDYASSPALAFAQERAAAMWAEEMSGEASTCDS